MWNSRNRSEGSLLSRLLQKSVLFCMFLRITLQQAPQYHYVNINKTWTAARTYCKENYKDLASTVNIADNRAVTAAVDSGFNGAIWIGLANKGTVRWQWSPGTGAVTVPTYWYPGRPSNGSGNDACGLMGSDGNWTDAPCNSTSNYACFKLLANAHKNYYLVKGNYTWKYGQDNCRTQYSDLATVTSAVEHDDLYTGVNGSTAWIGLFRDTWSWSNGNTNSFRNWQTGKPDNILGNESCAALVMNPNGQSGFWDDWDCGKTLPFLCYGDLKVTSRLVRLVRTSYAVDLSDLAMRNQLLEQTRARLVQQGVSDFNLTWSSVEKKTKDMC